MLDVILSSDKESWFFRIKDKLVLDFFSLSLSRGSVFLLRPANFQSTAKLTTVKTAIITVCTDRAPTETTACLAGNGAVLNFFYTAAWFPSMVISYLLILRFFQHKSEIGALVHECMNFSFNIVHARIRAHK